VEIWRLIVDPPLPGEINMQRDLQLLAEVASGSAPPTVRFYSWSTPALSLGRLQKEEEVVDIQACRSSGVDLVRRPTGGRAVLHDRELTYSITAPEDHPLIPGEVVAAYALINQGILAAFHRLSIGAFFAGSAAGSTDLAGGSCFDRATAFDLLVAGKKVTGSAQLRRSGAFLQQGTILLKLPLELYRQLWRSPEGNVNPAYAEILALKAAGLEDLGYPVAMSQLAESVAESLAKLFFIEFERAEGYFYQPGSK